MSNRPFRFVHAGDFHLELPPQGLAEIPDHLRELFVEAAYWAKANGLSSCWDPTDSARSTRRGMSISLV